MNKEEELSKLGQTVRSIRLAKGLTQTELANRIGKDHPNINRLENGKFNPSFIFLKEVAQGLEVDIREFFNYSEQI
jgi:transcriptional regulator with XRE-family HTH domain